MSITWGVSIVLVGVGAGIDGVRVAVGGDGVGVDVGIGSLWLMSDPFDIDEIASVVGIVVVVVSLMIGVLLTAGSVDCTVGDSVSVMVKVFDGVGVWVAAGCVGMTLVVSGIRAVLGNDWFEVGVDGVNGLVLIFIVQLEVTRTIRTI